MTLDFTVLNNGVAAGQADLQRQHDNEVQGIRTELSAAQGARIAAETRAATLAEQLTRAQNRPRTHKVVAGDTMTNLALKYGLTVQQIQTWNPNVVPTSMQVGTILNLFAPDAAPEPPPQPLSRFPGDPGSGKVIVGNATTGGNLTQLQAVEAYVGMKMVFRVFNNNGVADLRVPAAGQIPVQSEHPIAYKIWRDHRAGRASYVSPKLGQENLAAHQFGPQMIAFVKWVNAQPGITYMTSHHEGENDWREHFFNLPEMAKHAAVYREAHKWWRMCIDEASVGVERKLAYGGILMTYSFTPEGLRKFGPVNQWNPGEVNGHHVWDFCTGDHYEDSYTAASLDTQKWKDFYNWVTNTLKIPCGLTELGVNNGNINGGKVLADFLNRLTSGAYPNVVMCLYFNSHAGPGGTPQADPRDWWDLIEANGTLQAWKPWCLQFGVNPNAHLVT